MGWGGGSKTRKCTVWSGLLELLNRWIIVVKMKSRSKIRKRAGATAPFAKSCASYCRFARSFVSVKTGKRFFSGKFPPRWTVPFARNFRAFHTNRKRSRILLSFLFLFFYGLVGKYSLTCAREIQKIQMVVHIFSGFALFTELMRVYRGVESLCRTRCLLICQQTSARQNTVTILKLVSFERLARKDFFERGTQAEAHCERNLNRQLWSIKRKISHRCSRNFFRHYYKS